MRSAKEDAMRRCCPICGKEMSFETGSQPNPTHPFCSERCRLVDLGHWLEGTYSLVTQDESESTAQSALDVPGSSQNSIDHPKEL